MAWQVGACALKRRPWGVHQQISTLFAVILKHILSRNLDQSMLKNANFFLEKTTKIGSASKPLFAFGR